MYIWDFRKATTSVPPTTFFHVKTRSLTQDNNDYEKQEDFFCSKSPKLRSRMLAMPNLALYRERLDQVQAVCRMYGLGNRQNNIDHEKANAWTFNETRSNNDTRKEETRFYERMLGSSSRPIEKSDAPRGELIALLLDS